MPKKVQTTQLPHFALISYARKEMLKILQVGFQQYVNQDLPDFQAGFRKEKVTR